MAPRVSALDEMIGDTLAQVNVVREAFGYSALSELPDARPGDTRDCLYYRALKDVGCTGVGANKMTFDSQRKAESVAALWGVDVQGNEVFSPVGITRTISAFDSNQTPHYNV